MEHHGPSGGRVSHGNSCTEPEDLPGSSHSAALGVIAWSSLAIHRPFTLGVARQSTPGTFTGSMVQAWTENTRQP